MKRTNKKGFTIVELVIVIAVIAILAAVLIPNLSKLVDKANESKAMQEAKSAYEDYLLEETTENGKKTTPAEHLESVNLCIQSGKFYFHVDKGQFNATPVANHSTTTESVYTAKVVKDGKLGN